jgi:hypothetical protein
MNNEHKGYKWINKSSYKDFDDGSKHYKALEAYFQSS